MFSGRGWLVPPEWPDRPASILIWGSPEDAVHHVVLSVGRALDPNLHWLENTCGLPHDVAPPPFILREIPPERFAICDVWPAAPAGHVGTEAAAMIQAEERPRVLERLDRFLHLPPALQELLSRIPGEETGRVVSVSHCERAVTVDPAVGGDLLTLLGTLATEGITVVAGYSGNPGRRAQSFSTVIEVRGGSGHAWSSSEMVWHRPPPGSPARSGTVRPVSALFSVSRE